MIAVGVTSSSGAPTGFEGVIFDVSGSSSNSPYTYVQVVRRDSVLGTHRVRAEPDRDNLSELPSGERGHLHDVYVVDEQGIKLRDRPEELVFLE